MEASVTNSHGPRAPSRASVGITSPEASWSNASDGFDVELPYVVEFADGGTVHARLSATFGLHFTSGMPMTDSLFDVFTDINLPINTWPFLREFVSTTLGRMGWQSFTLPAFKHGMPDPGEDDADAAAKPKRRTTRRPKAQGA